MPTKKSKLTGGNKAFVRGADGTLYILTKDKPPRKLTQQETQKVEGIFDDAGKLVEERLKLECPGFGSMVNVHVSSFPELSL